MVTTHEYKKWKSRDALTNVEERLVGIELAMVNTKKMQVLVEQSMKMSMKDMKE